MAIGSPRSTEVDPGRRALRTRLCKSPVKTRLFPAPQHLFPNVRRVSEPQAPKSHGGPSAGGAIHETSARTAQAHW